MSFLPRQAFVLAGILAVAAPHVRSQVMPSGRTPARRAVAAPSRKLSRNTAPSQVRKWLQSLTLQEKAAQLVVIPVFGEAPNSRSREYRKVLRLVEERKVGGLILINRVRYRTIKRAEPFAFASFLNRMQKAAKIPLMVAGDFERGASMRVEGATLFPHAMAFGAARDPEATRYLGQATAREARALGVHWVLFPDADVSNNPENPVIGIRAFSENAEEVARHVRAFIDGAGSEPALRVLTTAKHFPGHGDTTVDSHLNIATVSADRARLDSLELVPFRAAIAAGVDSVMTAHLSVPAIEDPGLPATLSRKMLTGLLRGDLKFQGLIVTDALEMGGVAKGFSAGDAAVRALEAGADILLMPPDPEAAIRAVVRAVKAGRLSVDRLDASLSRWLAAKQLVGLDRNRFVDIEAIEDVLDLPEGAERADEIAQKAVTLVRNEADLLPLKTGDGACAVLLTENRHGIQGLAFSEAFRKKDSKATLLLLDPMMPEIELASALEQLAPCTKIAAAAFTSIVTYRNGDILPGAFTQFLQTLLDSGKPLALLSLGNPYLIRRFDKVAAYMTTYSPVAPAETAMVRALFGDVPPEGKLPVTIPGIAAYGDGLTYR
ncbi:MAG: glycoside hydrolase family 3 protein [Bryobacteraceae bacterium]